MKLSIDLVNDTSVTIAYSIVALERKIPLSLLPICEIIILIMPFFLR